MEQVKEVLPKNINLSSVDIWFQDETRIGQQGSLTRIWATKGTRPRIVRQQQFLCQYIYGAVCPSQKTCAALILPQVNGAGLQLHLEEIALHIPKGRFAVVVMDNAGWHLTKSITIPINIAIIHLPPYSPELNPQENIWRFLKDTWLANRTFESMNAIIDDCEKSWNYIAPQPDLIASIATREWATIHHTYL